MTDHETVVVKEGGSSTGLILGIIAIIIVLALGWYFLMGPGAGDEQRPPRTTRTSTWSCPAQPPQAS